MLVFRVFLPFLIFQYSLRGERDKETPVSSCAGEHVQDPRHNTVPMVDDIAPELSVTLRAEV